MGAWCLWACMEQPFGVFCLHPLPVLSCSELPSSLPQPRKPRLLVPSLRVRVLPPQCDSDDNRLGILCVLLVRAVNFRSICLPCGLASSSFRIAWELESGGGF